MKSSTWVTAVASLACAGAVHAASFCVNNGTQLQAALNSAAASNENDEIRLVRGTYTAASTFTYASANVSVARVLGGYAPGCGSRTLDARDTVLDGQGLRQVLSMTFTVQGAAAFGPLYVVENLTVQNGLTTSPTRGAGIALASFATNPAQTELWLDNVIVRNNSGHLGGGADLFAARGLIRVVNSLFVGNAAPASAFGHLSARVDATEVDTGTGVIVANSTFVNGNCAGQTGRGCGIALVLPTAIRGDIVNSVFSGNAISDVTIERAQTAGGSAFVDYSRVGSVNGDLAPTVTNAIVGDPGFVDPALGNFRLRADSILVNQGLGVPPIDMFNNFDLDGNPRVVAGALDVGAYERQPQEILFANGFE